MKQVPKKQGNKHRNKHKKSSWRQSTKHWMTAGTLGALVTCSAFDVKAAISTIPTKSPTGWEAVYATIQTQQPQRFDIPPGPLETVLMAFQNITEIKVLVPDDKLRTLSSPGVSGVYTNEQALAQILTGTGITYRFSGPKIVALELQGVAASVEILGRISPSSPKYTEPLRNTPQTITVIPKTVIEEQGATTLRDVLRNVTGLTMTAGEGGVPAGDNLTLRGFSARNDIFIDGARDLGPQSRDPFNMEQVEVVKGPGSAFTGRGSAGGSINLVSKAPGVNRSVSGTLSFGTDGTRRVTTDINVPIKDRTAFRLNLLAHDSGVAGRDAVENKRWGIAPSVLFGLGTRNRLTLSYFYMGQDNLPDYGIPWVTATQNVLANLRDQPAPVPRDTFYGQKARDFEKMRSDLGTIKFERDLNDTTTVRNQLRFSYSTRDSVTTAPRFASNDSLVINRNGPSWITKDYAIDNQTDLRSRFFTGKVEHSVVSGLALTWENNQRWTRTVTGTPTTTLYNPDPDQPFTGVIAVGPNRGDVTGKSLSAYAFDTVKLSKYIELNGGLRFDRFDVDGVTTALAAVTRVDEMLSWRGGVVVKPKEQGSVYVSYGTSLSPSLEGLSYGTANTAIEPEKTYNFEVGSKWDLIGERLSVNGAIFRVEKTNARTPGILPDDPPQVLQGRQRVDGVELGASGSITRALRVFGGYTFLDTEIVKSNTPAEIGKEIQNAPRHSFTLWSTYQFPKRVLIGGGPRFTGQRFGNNTNTRQVSGYWLLDAMASFPISKQIDLRLNLYNLTNEYYFDRLGGGHLIPGAGRSAMISTGFRF